MLVPLFVIPDRKIYTGMGTSAFFPGQSANRNSFSKVKHILQFKHLLKVGVENITGIKNTDFFEPVFKLSNIVYSFMQQGRLSENTDIQCQSLAKFLAQGTIPLIVTGRLHSGSDIINTLPELLL